MNRQWRKWILSAVFICLVAAGRAAADGVQVLSDKDLAQVTGGLCPFSTCETGLPSGNCQPIPPTMAGLCLARTCTTKIEEIGNTRAVQCILIGKVTCTGIGGYRQCVTGKIWNICWNSDQNVCGTLVEPHCAYNMADERCDCSLLLEQTPCDWTNCLLESQ
jgi:bacteriocin-like protein